MEKKNVERVISNDQFLNLLKLARKKDQNAINKIIELFYQDIKKVTKYIKSDKEDAYQNIVVEFMELIINNKKS